MCLGLLLVSIYTRHHLRTVPTGHHQPKLQPRRKGHGLCADQHRERQPSRHMGADPQDDHGSTLCVLPLLSFSHARNVASEPCLNSTASLRSSVRKLPCCAVFAADAWAGNPCCPSVNRFAIPCPPNSCPIQTWNSTLPAVPFWASIDSRSGNCTWVSTEGGAVF